MNGIRIPLCFALLALLLSCNTSTNHELRSLYKHLDYSIDTKDIYARRVQEMTDSLKAVLSQSNSLKQRLLISQQICFRYSSCNIDSALRYANLMESFALEINDYNTIAESRIDKARVLCSLCHFPQADSLLRNIDPDRLTKEIEQEYLLGWVTYHNSLTDFYTPPVVKQIHQQIAQSYRDSLLTSASLSHSTYLFTIAETLISQKKYDLAIETLCGEYNKLPPYSRIAGIISYSIARSYLYTGDKQKALQYYAISAISDIENGVKEYKSLKELASLLYEQGDIKRAYKYIHSYMEDAISCYSSINTLVASEFFVIVDNVYRDRSNSNMMKVVGSSILLFLLVFALIVTNVKLNQKKERIRRINDKLNDNVRVKDYYIGLYMGHSSSYLSKIRQLQRKLTTIARKSNDNSLMVFIDAFLNTDVELNAFYHEFDTAILSLFPSFVEDVNKLLLPGEEVYPKAGKALSPEFRILALIRLGVTDSVKIAGFLHYSLSTIYNYRTKMRNKAKGDRDMFEKRVAEIGIL